MNPNSVIPIYTNSTDVVWALEILPNQNEWKTILPGHLILRTHLSADPRIHFARPTTALIKIRELSNGIRVEHEKNSSP